MAPLPSDISKDLIEVFSTINQKGVKNLAFYDDLVGVGLEKKSLYMGCLAFLTGLANSFSNSPMSTIVANSSISLAGVLLIGSFVIGTLKTAKKNNLKDKLKEEIFSVSSDKINNGLDLDDDLFFKKVNELSNHEDVKNILQSYKIKIKASCKI